MQGPGPGQRTSLALLDPYRKARVRNGSLEMALEWTSLPRWSGETWKPSWKVSQAENMMQESCHSHRKNAKAERVRLGDTLEIGFNRVLNPCVKDKWKQVRVNWDGEVCALGICLQPAGSAGFEKPEARSWWRTRLDQIKEPRKGDDAFHSIMDVQETKKKKIITLNIRKNINMLRAYRMWGIQRY